jgi:outer membrane protein OmpA-like peptidoglycan-associated protein
VAANLIDLAKNVLTTEVLQRLGGTLGESPDHVAKAIEGGIPSILAGFLNMATSSGANRLFDMLKTEPPEVAHAGGLDGVLGNLGSLLGGGSMESLLKYGQTILSALFGGKLGSILDVITRSSGVKQSSASSLLGLLAPLLMGLLRKETASRGLSLSNLTNLLVSQKETIAKFAPAGLADAMGLRSLGDLGSVADSIKTAGAGAAREVGHAAAAAASESTAWLRWAAPLALLAAALLGLYYWYGSQQLPQPAPAPELVVAPAPRVADLPTPNLERANQAVRDAGKQLASDGRALIETASQRVPLTLPGNIKLDVPENSYLQAMVEAFTAGAGARAPKNFVADNLHFEGTTAKLTSDSSAGIASLATIMKAFTTAKLKIEGHTDNVGGTAENKKVALDRATSVKDALVKAGVPADRIIAEGVGPDRPIASNDTEDGRAKNRRLEFEVVWR